MGKITEYFVAQSAHPGGWAGRVMMRLMNRAYLPMAEWAVGLVAQPGLGDAMAQGGQDEAAGPRILDIGVGNGASSALLAAHYPGAEIVGLDISAEAIGAAQKKYGINTRKIEFIQADICAGLPFAAGSFWLVCAFQTHFHWGDIPAGWREARRLLAPGGLFVVAFETVKLAYFAPEQRDLAAVEELCRAAGFSGLHTATRGSWTAWLVKG